MVERRKYIFADLERKTRKKLIKYIIPIVFMTWLAGFLILLMAGSTTGLGIIGFIGNNMPYSIIITGLYIAVAPFLWFMKKSEMKSEAYDEILGELNKSLVDKMFVAGESIEVGLIKARDTVGDFVLDLQYDAADFYAELGEKDKMITIYAILKGENKRRKVDTISKEKFSEYYQLLDK